ncbi:MAG: hypothetical protein HZB16_23560 [Armatimonadetes bacterium]|nr:hypothetical protein [Armatimonadota bacterium]
MRKSLPSWVPPVVLAAVALIVYLASGPLRFPMDDAYIHLVYGRNLAELGALTFNTTPPDHGIGTTSILWTLLLTVGHKLVGVEAAARILGGAGLLAVVWLSWVIAGWMVPPERRAAQAFAASLVALSGNLLWFSLSGMETMLWLALGMGAVVAYRARHWFVVGPLLGLMTLTRVEGIVLLAALWLVELLVRRKWDRGLLLATVLLVLVWSPWMAFTYAKTGRLMPTSFSGKKHAQVRGAVEVVRRSMPVTTEASGTTSAEETRLPWWVGLLYPAGALGYGASFVAGGAYLPGPKIPLPGQLGEVSGGIAVLGVLAMLLLFLPCQLMALRRVGRVLRRTEDGRRLALAVLLVWFLLHNAAYWLKLPTPGTASRYQVVNHVAWWLLAGVGAWLLEERARRGALLLLGLLAMTNAAYWRGVFGADCRHMQEVRLAAASYLASSLPPGAVVAAHDIGALGWGGQRRILDMGGLIDPGYLAFAKAGRLRDWLRREGATYVALPDKHSSQVRGFYDYGAFLGLDAAHGILLRPVAHFENSYDDWKLGAAPTWNALPGVTIYALELAP